MIHDNFDTIELNPHWQPLLIGNGRVASHDAVLYCSIRPSNNKRYHDAQISDYAGLRRRNYPWRPPLRMQVRAWASHDVNHLRGTAGFGFWNQPFMPGQRWPRLPRAVWFFFGSPPNNMALAHGQPGYGWKAATFDAAQLTFLALAPLAPLGFLLMRVPTLYHRLWPIAQRAIGVADQQLKVNLTEPHLYELIWEKHGVQFRVDHTPVHYATCSPKGPLGFIAWIDNQYAIVTPQGRFGFGYVAVEEEQWLAIESISIEPL